MRARLVYSGASMMITAAIAAALTVGVVEHDYDDRLEALETRVARLEAEVGIGSATPEAGVTVEASGEEGEDGSVSVSSSNSSSTMSSSSSSSTTVQRGSSSFTATIASTGDQEVVQSIESAGIYRLTVQAKGELSVTVSRDGGNEVGDLSLAADGEETVSGTAVLEPGTYVIRVESETPWTVELKLIDE